MDSKGQKQKEKAEGKETQVEKHDEESDESTFEKGKGLENEFALFMKRELNWTKIRVGAHMPGKANRKGTSIDVIGERLDERGRKFNKIAIIWLVIAGFLLLLSVIWAVEEIDGGGIALLVFSITCMIGGYFFLYQSNRFNKENAWVECKNLKGKVNINQVRKSIEEFNDYRASGDKEYKFEEHYFVSSSGYIENALKYAVEHQLICYEKRNGSFIKVGYWD